jgi:hypothetical protein
MAQELTWREYRSGGGYTVQLPEVPTIESQLVNNPTIGGSVTLKHGYRGVESRGLCRRIR